MCSGALKGYLTGNNAMPDAPLIAMVPVNLRTAKDADGGNVASAVLCNLATNVDDPAQRLAVIQASMRDNKTVLSQLPRAQAIAVGLSTTLGPTLLEHPAGLGAATRRRSTCASPTCPGAAPAVPQRAPGWTATTRCRWWSTGGRSTSPWRPVPTAWTSGWSGARRAVPHLQRLLGHLETSLKDLEVAVGV